MSAAIVRLSPVARPERTGSSARVVVVVWLGVVTLVAAVLMAASFLPSPTLVGRLLGAAGEVGAGPIVEDLIAHVGARLRLAAGLLVVLAAGLVALRAPFEDLVGACLRDRVAPRWPTRAEAIGVGSSMVLAAGLRLAFLNQPMRYDEAMSFNDFASRPLYHALSFYPDPNNHLLNTLLVHFAVVGLGNQPWIIRLPAFIAGVLLVPATYWLARLLHGGSGGAIFSALLVGVSSYLVEYSANSRGYALQTLAFVVLLSLVMVGLRRDSASALLLAALVAAVGAYAVPTMLYGIAVAGVWFGVRARGARLAQVGLRHLAASGLVLGMVAALAYLPVLVVSGPDKLVMNRFVKPLDMLELMNQLPPSLARTWTLWNRDVALPIAGALVIGIGVATLAEARQGRAPLSLLAVATCAAIVLMQRVAPFERVWLFLLPVYFVLSVEGLVRLGRGRIPRAFGLATGFVAVGVLALTTLTSGSILGSPETGRFPDAEAVARTLAPRLGPGDAVLTTVPASAPELQYYFARWRLPIESLVRPPEQAEHLFVVAEPDAAPNVEGWAHPEQIGRFSGSVVLVLERASAQQ